MTAALGEVAAGAAGAEGAAAGGGRAAAASRAAPTSSAPVGTAGKSAESAGSKARTQNQLRGGKSSSRSTSTSDGGKKGRGKKNGGRSLLTPITSGKSSTGGWASRGRGRQLLVAEFVACIVILALSPLTDKHKTDTPGQWMKRGTAVCGTFLVLGLVASGGKGAAKVAATFGGLVTLVLLLSDRDVLVAVTNRLGAPVPQGTAGPPDSGGSLTDPSTPSNNAGTGGPPDNFGIPPTSNNGGSSLWDWLVGGLGPI